MSYQKLGVTQFEGPWKLPTLTELSERKNWLKHKKKCILFTSSLFSLGKQKLNYFEEQRNLPNPTCWACALEPLVWPWPRSGTCVGLSWGQGCPEQVWGHLQEQCWAWAELPRGSQASCSSYLAARGAAGLVHWKALGGLRGSEQLCSFGAAHSCLCITRQKPHPGTDHQQTLSHQGYVTFSLAFQGCSSPDSSCDFLWSCHRERLISQVPSGTGVISNSSHSKGYYAGNWSGGEICSVGFPPRAWNAVSWWFSKVFTLKKPEMKSKELAVRVRCLMQLKER